MGTTTGQGNDLVPPILEPNGLIFFLRKVRKKWAHILGGEVACHWHDAVVRGALRKELGREPSAQESAKYAEKLRDYAALAKELGDDIDRAFCSGQEVTSYPFSLDPLTDARTTRSSRSSRFGV